MIGSGVWLVSLLDDESPDRVECYLQLEIPSKKPITYSRNLVRSPCQCAPLRPINFDNTVPSSKSFGC